MPRSLPFDLAFLAVLFSSTSQGAGAQQLTGLSVGLHQAANPAPTSATPSAVVVHATAVGWGASLAVGGGGVGSMIDDVVCKRRHRGETRDLFGPCLFYAGPPTATGWFGGAVVGATIGAARTARRRGCPERAAWQRAFGGALLGVAPGTIAAIAGGDRFPPRKSALIFSAPLLAGVAAAAAVVGCHGRPAQ